jgi:hypothetical protein
MDSGMGKDNREPGNREATGALRMQDGNPERPPGAYYSCGRGEAR